MAAPPAAGILTARRFTLRAKLHLVDYTILGLAAASLGVFLLHVGSALTGIEAAALMYVDIALIALYGALFCVKWTLAPEPARWFRTHAFWLLGMLPLTQPVLVPERYYIVVQVLVLVLRTGKALDRAFGAHILSGLFDRYRWMVVEELTEPLLMRLAVLLEESLTSRDYAAAIGKRLDERRDLVESAVARAIAASPKLTLVSRFGPAQRLIDDTTREVVDAAHAALTGPEINALIREGLHDAFTELKQGIAERKWQRKGVGVTEVARSVIHVTTEADGAMGPPPAPLARQTPVLRL